MLKKTAKFLIDRLFPGFGISYRRMREQRDFDAEPVPTPLGFKLIGNPQMVDGSFEPEETKILAGLLPGFDLFVNVGANIGYYCCLALHNGVPTIAIEPIDSNLHHLQKNILANGFENAVQIFPVGVSDKPGIAKIYGGGTGASLVAGWAGTSNQYFRYIPINTLDTLLQAQTAGRKTLVLMDIEGAELAALKGAHALLTQEPKPTWFIEICISEHQPEGRRINPDLLATFEMFWQHGYVARTADLAPVPVGREIIEQIAQSGQDTLSTHNFIFTPAA